MAGDAKPKRARRLAPYRSHRSTSSDLLSSIISTTSEARVRRWTVLGPTGDGGLFGKNHAEFG